MKTGKALWVVLVSCISAMSTMACAQANYVQVVEQRSTTLQLTALEKPVVGLPVTFVATLSPDISGTVSFSLSSNAIPLQRVQMATPGKAKWTVTFPSAGTYIVLAKYAGDNDYTESTATLTENVAKPGTPNFKLSIPAAPSITPGQTWKGVVHLTAVNGFHGKVSLSCGSGIDPTLNCHLTPALITAEKQGASIQISVSTIAAKVAVTTGALLPLFALLPLGDNKRRRAKTAAILLMIGLAVAGAGLIGCGTRNRFTQGSGTLPGTYYVNITGTSGKLTHTATATVVVK